MMMSEFIALTGFEPMYDEYQCIETAYYAFDGDKQSFCKSFIEHAGIEQLVKARASKILQQEDSIAEIKHDARLASERHSAQVKRLEEALEREQEWRPYEAPQNIPQSDYETLAKDAESGKASHYMSDDEAKDWICSEFDFDRSKITIVHKIDEFEISRHNHLRNTGKQIDRHPVYCATDYHYIRFNTNHWHYEVWNGQLRPFYD